jgi:hypothetical protein
MPRMSQERCHEFRDRRRRSRRSGIAGMSHNPQHTIFREGAGRPGCFAGLGKPFMRLIMLNMRRVDQCDQHIYIQQKPRHSNSSRSCWTRADVTRGDSGRTGSNGTPFRVFRPVSAGCRAPRAKAEMTSPTLFRCVIAISFAAASTSSSIANVVRIDKT